MTKLGKSITFLIIILVLIIGFFLLKSIKWDTDEPTVSAITNFKECASAGYTVMESYPRQCRDDKGQLFVEVIENPVVIEPTEDPDENPIDDGSVNNAEYSKEILFKINDTKTFSDGLIIKLKEINDSRCKEGVQCIWAGELAGTFLVSGGAFSPSVEIILGTTNNKSIILKGYKFTLVSATETEMKVIVEKI